MKRLVRMLRAFALRPPPGRAPLLLVVAALPLACGRPPTSALVTVATDGHLAFGAGKDFDTLTLFVRPADPSHAGLSKSYDVTALTRAGFPDRAITVALYPGASDAERVSVVVDASRTSDGNLASETSGDFQFAPGKVAKLTLTLPWQCRAAGDPLLPGVDCPGSETCCGGKVCADLGADLSHCGACGNVCTKAQSCQQGFCLPCTPGEVTACSVAGQRGVCAQGQAQCGAGGTYGACVGTAPQAEICGNGLDDDCDGRVDDTCVSTLAGSAATLDDPGTQAEEGGAHADGYASTARFHMPAGITADGSRQLYVADALDDAIRRVDLRVAPPVVTTIAGSCPAGAAGCTRGFADGPGASALFDGPCDVAWLPGTSTVLYVADRFNGRVRRVAGSIGAGFTVSTALDGLTEPCGVAVDPVGNVYALEVPSTDWVWQIPASGAPPRKLVFAGGNWSGSCGLAADSTGLYLSDAGGGQLWRLTLAGQTAALVTGSGGLSLPRDLALVGGALWVVDRGNERIMKLDLAKFTYSKVAGVTGTYGWQDGPAAQALFARPFSFVALGTSLYIADSGSHTIRQYVLP